MLEKGGSNDGLPELLDIELLEVCGISENEGATSVDGAGRMIPPNERRAANAVKVMACL